MLPYCIYIIESKKYNNFILENVMNYELIYDMFYAAPEFWVISGIVLVLIFMWFYTKIMKLKRKNYFLNRDRERYAETLYALKDGYFAFIYPDKRINDYRRGVRERCSRRLAVTLNLKDGTNSKFDEVLEQFYKEDAKKIQKYLGLLRDDGVAFEDAFLLKNSNSYITLAGSRINGYDGNVYCDLIWFRDVSLETKKIMSLEEQKLHDNEKIAKYETMINGLPYPAFLRDENLNIIIYNKKYADFATLTGKDSEDMETEFAPRNAALLAQTSNKVQKQDMNMVIDGKSEYFSLIETPVYDNNNLEKICTVGALIDVSELDELKRNLKLHQNVHLQVLSMLGTAFCTFGADHKLSFYNDAFVQMFKLEQVFLSSLPTYQNFLDVLREKRMLPEVPDFKAYKREEQKEFDNLIENKEDLMHLPDGRTLRRVRAAQPRGGLIFAFEDITDRLATRQAYNLQQETQKDILDNMSEAILIFSSGWRLKQYNNAYMKLWQVSEEDLNGEPLISDVLDMQKKFFTNTENWENLKSYVIDKIISNTYQTVRSDGVELIAKSVNLPDDSIMIIYKKK